MIRTGFVSNSSSSSYLIYFGKELENKEELRSFLTGLTKVAEIADYCYQDMLNESIKETSNKDFKKELRNHKKEHITEDIIVEELFRRYHVCEKGDWEFSAIDNEYYDIDNEFLSTMFKSVPPHMLGTLWLEDDGHGFEPHSYLPYFLKSNGWIHKLLENTHYLAFYD